MKSTISNSLCHKQQANSLTAQSNDHTDHSVADTLPMSASNSVHHTPMDIGPTSDNKTLNSIMSSSCSTASNTQSINVHSGDHLVHGSSYTVNMVHVTYHL